MSTHSPNPSLLRFLVAGGRRIAAAGTFAVLGVALAGTAVAAPTTLSPQLEPRLVGAVHWPATSGDTNYYSMVLEPSDRASQFAARTFRWSERSDAPCWARLDFSALASLDSQSAALARCSKHDASMKSVWRGDTQGSSIKGIGLGCRAVQMRAAIQPATPQGAG